MSNLRECGEDCGGITLSFDRYFRKISTRHIGPCFPAADAYA
jgi:hypothetical protein